MRYYYLVFISKHKIWNFLKERERERERERESVCVCVFCLICCSGLGLSGVDFIVGIA